MFYNKKTGRNKIARIIATFLAAIGIFVFVSTVSAQETIRINDIALPNFISDVDINSDIVQVLDTESYRISYSPADLLFQIFVTASPFEEVRLNAEDAFLQELQINRNEACFLRVRTLTSSKYNPDVDGYYGLSFCENEILADVNQDEVINAFDFAICLDEFQNETNTKAWIANDAADSCDFDMNAKIDALDLSIVLANMGKATE